MKVNQYIRLIREGYIGPHASFTPTRPTFSCIVPRCTTNCPSYRANCKFAHKHGITVSHTAIPALLEQLVDYPEFFI